MTTKWAPFTEHHGNRHPTCDAVYFSICAIGNIGRLSGFVTPEEFRRLARLFGVSSVIKTPVTIVNDALLKIGAP